MEVLQAASADRTKRKAPAMLPRIGFLGLGWIGVARMQALAETGTAEICGMADPSSTALDHARQRVPNTPCVSNLNQLLELKPDGIVIATPSALHADQAQQVLRSGIPVFCQKPLARTAAETRRIVDTAQAADVLLGIDFSYRHVQGVQAAQQLVQSGELGRIFSVDMLFHNAYGPDKSWFYDLAQSGGGCVMDLGTHLCDLAFWMLGDQHRPCNIRRTLWHQGRHCQASDGLVEDAAMIDWDDSQGVHVRLGCSWNLHAGQDAVIEMRVYGTRGAVVLQNINGSFYDLVVEHQHGTSRTALADVDDNWGGQALAHWANQLAQGSGFDPQISSVIRVAELIDEVYQR